VSVVATLLDEQAELAEEILRAVAVVGPRLLLVALGTEGGIGRLVTGYNTVGLLLKRSITHKQILLTGLPLATDYGTATAVDEGHPIPAVDILPLPVVAPPRLPALLPRLTHTLHTLGSGRTVVPQIPFH